MMAELLFHCGLTAQVQQSKVYFVCSWNSEKEFKRLLHPDRMVVRVINTLVVCTLIRSLFLLLLHCSC